MPAYSLFPLQQWLARTQGRFAGSKAFMVWRKSFIKGSKSFDAGRFSMLNSSAEN